MRPDKNFATALVLMLAASTGACSAATSQGAPLPPRAIGHVFIIVLENKGYASTFGAKADGRSPYLSRDLPGMGALLTQYYAIGHSSLPNYIAMVSGQSPNPETQKNCPVFLDWKGATTPDADGQVAGTGCVYPDTIRTIGNQLQDAGGTWKAYLEDMGNDPKRDGGRHCAHPAIGAVDRTPSSTAEDQYATRHNPFMYHHAIIDDVSNCQARVVALDELSADLRTEATTPNYAFVVPNLCHDGHDTNCPTGEPGGLVSADPFLRQWVGRILASRAFRKDGLLIVTFDEAARRDTAACCNEPTGPNTRLPGKRGPGGGRVGAVLISPFIRPGTVSDVPYNHYSMLKSVEQLLGLDYLGFAGQAGLVPFGPDVFTRPTGSAR